MKKLLFIIGGQAVGKMTVGEELSKITGLKLYHNHMSVELANHFYGFAHDVKPELQTRQKELFAELRDGLRDVVFKNIARSYLDGMIFTCLIHFDCERDWELTECYKNLFIESAKENGEQTEFYVVELFCDMAERQKRNTTENRLNKKPSKRNLQWSEKELIKTMENHRLISNEQDQKRMNAKQYLKIDNTNLSAEQVAQLIKKEFAI